MVVELTHPEYGPLKVLGIPIKLSETPGAVEKAPPKFGEHNRDVLRGLGYNPDYISALMRDEIVCS